MRVAIIGGGLTGLTAAYTLSKQGHAVTVFEKETSLGGLTYGFRQKLWDWHIEGAYHHLFTNDTHIISLIRELGLEESLIIKRPITANYIPTSKLPPKPGFDSRKGTTIFQLDSPIHLFRFPTLSILDKLRTALALGFLKTFPIWQLLENITAEHYLISVGGIQAWETIWKPLLYGKFSNLAPTVSAAWFWARIVKRTPKLCYIDGGFQTLIDTLKKAIINQGGKIVTGKKLSSLPQGFDRWLLTVPTPIAFQIIPKLSTINHTLSTIPHLTAQTLIIETDKPILKDVYWLNVTDQSFPFLAAVAHTNFMNPSHYGGRHLTYFGNYLPHDHPYLSMTKAQLLKKFLPSIHRLSPHLKYTIHNTFLFVGPFAQPVHQLRYSQKIPPIKTQIPGIYMANMDYVVPWDRGTNYAVELGMRAARIISSQT